MKPPEDNRLSRRQWLLAGGATLLASAPFTVASADEPKPNPSQERLDELSDWVKGKGGQVSAAIVDLQSGRQVGAVNASQTLNPASNMKLVTAAVALDLLGPNFRFQTGLYGHVRGSKLDTLVLRGHGDPSLSEAGLWRLANALSSLGVTEVEQLVVDQSRFDDQFVPPAFGQQPDEWATFRAPVSAIAVDRNTVTLNVLPTQPGSAAKVWFQPAGVVEVSGDIATKERGQGQNIQLQLAQTAGGLSATVGGHIAEGLPRQRFAKRIDDPRIVPGAVLKALLEREGVKVKRASVGASEEKARITYHGSDALSDLLAELGKHSDNFYAEMIFKTLPSQTEAGPLTFQKAADSTISWLRDNGALTEGTIVKNGSGLFDANRLSAETLVRVLQLAYRSPRLGSEYLAHLAIGGVDGTLRSRFKDLAKSRQVRAKTGTLNAVNSLSGYVLKKDLTAPFAFSILVNGVAGQHGKIRAMIDRVVHALG